jgi:hypothetical protein
MYPDDLSQKLVTIIKYDILPSHSEKKQAIIIPGKSGLEFQMTASQGVTFSRHEFLTFRRTYVSGLLRVYLSVHSFIYGFNRIILHHIRVVKCINTCPKFILDAEFFADVKLACTLN